MLKTRLILGAILLAPFVASAQVDVSLAVGRVLIADKDLHDPHFEKTVIVLLSYDEDEGAGGLILNRPSETTVSQALKEFPESRGDGDPAYEGGPVETKQVLALLHSSTKLEDAEQILPGVYTVGTTKLLRKVLAQKMDIRVFAGYAGWGPGQLEAEVDAGAWHVQRGQESVVFDKEPESMWPRMIRKLDTQIAGSAVKYQNALLYAPSSGSVSSHHFLHGVLRHTAAAGNQSCRKFKSPTGCEASATGSASGHHRI